MKNLLICQVLYKNLFLFEEKWYQDLEREENIMKKISLKKILMLGLATMMAVSAMNMSVMAEEVTSVSTAMEIVEYNIYSDIDSNVPLEGSEKIEYMNSHDQTPGTIFNVGAKKYKVLDDYTVAYIGQTEDTSNLHNLTESVTRGDYPPSTRGYLPYSGRYGMYNYLYTNAYFIYSGAPSVEVTVTADQAQTLRIEWIDGRNNEAMDYTTVNIAGGNSIARYAWAYDSEPFYIKFVNAGSGRISGDFTIALDQS